MARYRILTTDNYREFFPQNRALEKRLKHQYFEPNELSRELPLERILELIKSEKFNSLEKLIATGRTKPIDLSKSQFEALKALKQRGIDLVIEPVAISQEEKVSSKNYSFEAYMEHVVRALNHAQFIKVDDDLEPLDVNLNFDLLNLKPETNSDYSLKDSYFVKSELKDTQFPSKVLKTHGTPLLLSKLPTNYYDQSKGYYLLSRVFRRQTEDATHKAEFHQLDFQVPYCGDRPEQALLQLILKILCLLGLEIKNVRFRPIRLPYTSPSFDVVYLKDVTKGYVASNVIELAGSGIMRKDVMTNFVKVANKSYSLAMGIGVERLYIFSALGAEVARVDKL